MDKNKISLYNVRQQLTLYYIRLTPVFSIFSVEISQRILNTQHTSLGNLTPYTRVLLLAIMKRTSLFHLMVNYGEKSFKKIFLSFSFHFSLNKYFADIYSFSASKEGHSYKSFTLVKNCFGTVSQRVLLLPNLFLILSGSKTTGAVAENCKRTSLLFHVTRYQRLVYIGEV